jgi:hypothetical protein
VKIKLDENLPDRLVVVLTALGHNVDTVRTEQIFPMSAAIRPALMPVSFLCA